jgi:hypothetical protein
MSGENTAAREIPTDDDTAQRNLTALGRESNARVVPPRGAALSVLWWDEEEPTRQFEKD